jgi:hypothetical protein
MVFLHPGASAHRQHPRRPGGTDVFVPPIRCRLQHRLAGELASLRLPGGIGVQGEDQRADLADPIPAPAVDTKGFDHGVGHPLLLLHDAKAPHCRVMFQMS